MPKEFEPSISEREFVQAALLEGKRVDGRTPYDVRAIEIHLGPEYGAAEVTLGKTRVAARASATVVRPFPDRPNEGQFMLNLELSPMASATFETGRASEEEVLVTRVLEKAIRQSRAVDTESLCILAGEKVWSVRVDVHVLDHHGNLIDCATMAVVAALLHFRRPDVTVIGEDVTIHTLEERNPVPLALHHIPICISFAFFEDGQPANHSCPCDRLVMDPSRLEERLQDGDMTVTVNTHRELCALSKAGGSPLPPDQVMRCVQLAATKGAEITNLIRKAVQDTTSRTRPGGGGGIGLDR
ncbi:ribosomal protein S5 domain 2-type protein [Thamnocephalis sphaerospora]|uniref:Exosome complex component RRP45 n=1 Tax=Thamnocephalis sphaerospora TaxID=78915 RepID=A0A4P9XWY0_9FUNG|nr:ribosomal protein S5 domain 2-type protein [Thamnocephalis sphaerospora]|eukprot:RKP09940.1 ribosomal protein S5 domain 2-type protein [Thamnocephalis sphaerospora]